MKLLKLMPFSLIFCLGTIYSLSLSSHACDFTPGWAHPEASERPISISSAIEEAKIKFKVLVQKSKSRPNCDEEINFDVLDAQTKQFLASMPILTPSKGISQGRYLLTRLKQLLKTSRKQLIALEKAKLTFFHDSDALREELGIAAEISPIVPITHRTRQNGQEFLVQVILENHCTKNQRENRFLIHQIFPIKTIQYIAGRVDYAPHTIYQKGELRKAILSHEELKGMLKNPIHDNAEYCPDDAFYKKKKWIEIEERFNGSTLDLIQNAVQRFKQIKQKPISAYMLNKNRIAIVFSDSVEKQFAGTIEEMVEIQVQLSRKGILVDKRSKLDARGKVTVALASEPEQSIPMPASLQLNP